jgi:hypothetical protein
MSAANIALLEGDSQYVDLAKMDEKKLLPSRISARRTRTRSRSASSTS